MAYRPTTGVDGTNIQQALTVAPGDSVDQSVDRLMLGVVLEVFAPDEDKTRSAQQRDDRRGYVPECTVLIMDDGNSAYLVLENVLITPDAPSGLDDYCERLPRGSSALVSGADLDSTLKQTDPYDLDGDWCVVGFIGGRLEAPFILRWWPNSNNSFDPATSGHGQDDLTLVQKRRYFRRTNGVETVITSKGDIIVSTTFANSTVQMGTDPSLGRFARAVDEEVGGSIRVNIKPSQTLEVTFNPQEEGIGIVDSLEPELPQTNPPPQTPEADGVYDDTYIYADRDRADIQLPENLNITIGTDLNITCGNNATIAAEKVLELEGTEQIKLGAGAGADPVVLGEQLRTWLLAANVLSPFGPLKIDPTQIVASSIYDNTQSAKSVVE